MKYPYIARLKSDDTKIALFTCPETATALTDNFADINLGESDSEWDESFYTDITHEYLSNTWGVVESKEHAEFIIELGELHGLPFNDLSNSYGKFFSFDSGTICFLTHEFIAKSGCKQITIPLPPKAEDVKDKISYTIKKGIQAKKDCEDFELAGVDSTACTATLSVSFNDNDEIVGVECESSPHKAKDWPQVGNEVAWGIESSGVIKSLSDGFAWIKQGNNDYTTVYISSLQKPKSKQDLLIEELQTKLCNNNAVDNYILACDIINGDIDGLSYGL